MTSAASDYLENALLNHVLRNTAYTQPTALRVRLWSTLPNDAGTGGVEIVGGGYAFQLATFAAASGGTASNSAIVDFGTASATWGVVTGATVGDQSGNILFLGALPTAKYVAITDSFRFEIGALVVSLD